MSYARYNDRKSLTQTDPAIQELAELLAESKESSLTKVTKEDGRYVIETISTAAVWDRQDEMFTTQAMDYDIQEAYRTKDFPEYRVFHSKHLGIGKVTEMRRIGIFAYDKGYSYDDPFSLQICEKMLANNEDGRWRTSRGFRAQEVHGLCPDCSTPLSVIQKHMLAGFRCPKCSSVHLTYRGIFKDIRFMKARTFDISITDVPVVPYTSAAAYRQLIMEKGIMDKETLKERLLQAGVDAEAVDARLARLSDAHLKELDDIPDAEVLKDLGFTESEDETVVEWKDMHTAIQKAAYNAVVEALDNFELVLPDTEIEHAISKAFENFQLELTGMQAVEERLKSMEDTLSTLLQKDEERLKSLTANAPRKAMLRVQRFKSVEIPEEAEEDDEEDEEQEMLEKSLGGVMLGEDGQVFASATDWLLGGQD